MKHSDNIFFLLIIVFLEGFVILSSELVGLRITIPFVGSGTDTASIIIAAVLIPLAIGYQAGGHFRLKTPDGQHKTIRKKLLQNIVGASLILLIGLSHFLLTFFFSFLDIIGIENVLIKATLYCLLFLSLPVYWLGQTVPLVSNYFSKKSLSRVTGRMLFFSTLGSFCGSVITTLFLMDLIGVHHTVTVIFILLTYLVLVLAKKQTQHYATIMVSILILSAVLNSEYAMHSMNIVKNNKYSTISIFENKEKQQTHMSINNNDSSMYGQDGGKHPYVEFAESIIIDSRPESSPPLDILVIGAGGFTFGHGDLKNQYIYIDIDKDLKPVAEQYLLKEPLEPNKTFYPLPARGYLSGTDKVFDVILLDAYLGALSIPEHLVTKEFFEQIKSHLAPNGVVLANFIVSKTFTNLYSKNIDNTLRSVFPYLSRHHASDNTSFWGRGFTEMDNFIYIYKNHDTVRQNATTKPDIQDVP